MPRGRRKSKNEADGTRNICYRFTKGAIYLRVPNDWIQQPAELPDRTLVLRSPKLDGSTFCISIIRIPKSKANTPREALAMTQHAQSGRLEELPNGKALLTHTIFSDQGATETRLWHLGISLLPAGALVALFSYSFAVRHRSDTQTQQHLALLDEQIRHTPGPVSIDITDYIKNFRLR